jgi:hypothetical protein
MDDVFEPQIAEIYEETRAFYQDRRAALGRHDCGLRILYGPVFFRPGTLIVGFSPGGDLSHATREEMYSPPTSNEYLSQSWPLARQLRRRFTEDFVGNSIGTNTVFFRAPCVSAWERIPQDLRDEMARFSMTQLMRLFHTLMPDRVLILGWDALANFKRYCGIQFTELVATGPSERPRRRRLLQIGTVEGIPAFGIPHPSAAWRNPPVTDEDWEKIVEIIQGA